MDADERFGVMVDACLKAHAAVVTTGTPEMVALMRTLLLQIGQGAARRAGKTKTTSTDAMISPRHSSSVSA